jgi:hypothetical protein
MVIKNLQFGLFLIIVSLVNLIHRESGNLIIFRHPSNSPFYCIEVVEGVESGYSSIMADVF